MTSAPTPSTPATADRPNVHGLRPDALAAHLVARGAPCTAGHARSLLASALAFHPAARPKRSAVPRAVRLAFDEHVDHRGLDVVERVTDPADGFVKYLLRSPDGALSEAVRIPLEKPGMYTVCLSSQVGCAMGCTFCATGRLGLTRHLAAWEIVAAWKAVRDELPADGSARVTGVVFMGQGEPLHNYDEVLAAAGILSDPSGGRIKAESISISTVGVVPAMLRYAAEGHRYRLIVSLTSAVEARRARYLPVTRRWGLGELAAAIRTLFAAHGERVTVAWVVMAGVNTGQDEVDALRALLGDLPLRVNLIDVNDATGAHQRADPAELDAFRDRLRALGVPVVRRYSGGRERDAACGMLAATRHAEDLATPVASA
ncbi:MAG: radical SAM protein [Myxococcota bacterium]